MLVQTESLYATTHEAFWDAKANKYLENGNPSSVKKAFIGYVIHDWLNDINFEVVNQPDILIATWGTYEKYDKFLLQSMLHPKKIIKQIEKIYKKNKEEILEVLGDDDPSGVNDISADFYYSNGIEVLGWED